MTVSCVLATGIIMSQVYVSREHRGCASSDISDIIDVGSCFGADESEANTMSRLSKLSSTDFIQRLPFLFYRIKISPSRTHLKTTFNGLSPQRYNLDVNLIR